MRFLSVVAALAVLGGELIAADGYWIGSYESTRNQNWTYANNWKDGVIAGRYKVGGEIVGDYGSTAYFGSKSADWFMIPQFNSSPLESVFRIVVDGKNYPQFGNSQYHLIPMEEGGGFYVTSNCTADVKVLAKPCVYQNTFAATNYFVNESSGHTLSLNNGLANAVFNAAKFCNPVFRFGGCGNISFGGGMPACNNFRNYVQMAFTDGGVFTLTGTATFEKMLQIATVKDCGPQTIRITDNAVCAPGLGNETGSGLVANTDLNVVSNGTLKLMSANNSAAALAVAEGCTMTVETTLKPSVDGVPLRVLGSGDKHGGVLRVTGPNLFTGNVQVGDGATFETATIGSSGDAGPLGSGSKISLYKGGAVSYVGEKDETADRPISLSNGSGVLAGSGSGALTYTGSVTATAEKCEFVLGGNSKKPSVFAGTIATEPYTPAFAKSGQGEWILKNWQNTVGDVHVAGGTLTIPAGESLTSGAATKVTIGGEEDGATLKVEAGASVSGAFTVASGSTSVGAVYQDGGTVNRISSGASSQAWIGYNGLGYYRLAGGTVDVDEAACVIGNGGQGFLDQLGGEVRLGGTFYVGYSGAGFVRQRGGLLSTGAQRIYLVGSGAKWSSFYVIEGDAVTDLGEGTFYLAGGGRTGVKGPLKAIINLNGGELRCNGLGRHPSYLLDTSRSYVNFNGGSYMPTKYTSPFGGAAGSYPTIPHRVTVFERGMTINVRKDASYGSAIPFKAPTGNSVISVPLPPQLADRTFSAPPYVEIFDVEGQGDGATACVEVDPTTKRLTKVTVTSPGWDYVSAKAVFVMADQVLCTNDCSLAAVKSGGFTKIGEGAFELSQTNTYTGATVVKAGTLRLMRDDVIDPSSALVLDGGTFNLNNHHQVFSDFDCRSGSVTGGKIGLSGIKVDFDAVLASKTKTIDMSFVDGFTEDAALAVENLYAGKLDPSKKRYQLVSFRNGAPTPMPDVSGVNVPDGWHLSVSATGIRLAVDSGLMLIVR